MRQLGIRGHIRMAVSKILFRGSPVQRLMRANAVVNPLPVFESVVEVLKVEIFQVDFIELLRMGPLGSLHVTVEFGTFGR
jgi:hypothetical protein